MNIRIILVIILCFAFMGSSMYYNGMDDSEFSEIESQMDYDNINISNQFIEGSLNENNTYIERGIYKYVDIILFLSLEISGDVARYGYDNPKQPYKILIYVIILSLFSSLLVPAIYLIVFMYFGFRELYKFIKSKLDRRTKNVE